VSTRNPFLNAFALCCLTLVGVSCASDETAPAGQSAAELEAAEAQLAAGRDRPEPVACTLISEIPNGVCGRPESDPCRFQDPDCLPGPTPPVDPGGVACAAFIEESDNVCSRPADDPCKSQDPDCVEGGGGPQCPLIFLPSDGVCSPHPHDPRNPCGSQDPDCAPGGGGEPSCEPVACTLIEEASDGVCSRPIDDPCKSQDPDCSTDPVVCALFIEAADGMCSRFTNDPCIGQDPDCRPARR
jgi:hypothetical protein